MEFTINCTRVPIPQGTTLFGIPVDEGPAPALQDPVSNHAAPQRASNDGDAFNPNGRVSPNREESASVITTPSKHLSCRVHTTFSTFNARTLGPLGRLDELVLNASLQNIDVIAVQEHRFYHPNVNLKYHKVDSYQFVSSSGVKNSINSTVGGIGFLISSKAIDNVLNIESISPRIMVLEFEGNPKQL